MKKLAAILLGCAMFATGLAGLVGCKDKNDDHQHVDRDNDGKCDVCDTPMGLRREDPRADVYEAFDHEGNSLGAFKTIGLAINAVIEGDLDYFEDEDIENTTPGGYVKKKDGTRKLFQNKKGLTDSYGDQFWLYPNGNTLGGYGSWDEQHMTNYLRNQKNTVHAVASFGQVPMQFYSGFGLLDEHGNEDTTSATPVSWALGTAIDAGVMVFPSSAGGSATGYSRSNYTIDLSDVKITPAYRGVETPVYAYFGYYIWNPFYVLAIGLGCDTTTGKWYEFCGTSRDDSFSEVEYDIGDCIMESNWDIENGYFVPQSQEVKMQIETVKMQDEYEGTDYYVCELNIAVTGGKTLSLSIDDEFLGAYFSEPVNIANDYMFIAGLDVKNEIGSGVKVKNVDYFNGAKFEGLRVTDAHVYFPTEEEISDVDYGQISIPEEVRGNEYDFLLANEEEAVEDAAVTASGKPYSAYGYTILSNYMCTSYTAEDGTDRYDFRFDGDPVADEELGGKLKEYQDEIDSLSEMTVENFSQYMEEYEKIGKWYGVNAEHEESVLAEFYYSALDFAPYLAAQDTYLEAMNISDAGKAVLAKLDALPLCAATTHATLASGFIDWEAPEGTNYVGYLWSEAVEFNKVRQELNALEDKEEPAKVIRLSKGGEENFDLWAEFYDSVSEYLNNEEYTSKKYTVGTMTMDGKFEELDGKAALIKVIKIFYRARENWFGRNNKDLKANVLDSNSQECTMYTIHALFILEKMKEEGVEIPTYVDTLLDLIAPAGTSAEGFVKDFREYLYPVLTKIGDIYKRQQKGEFVWLDQELADFINKYMVGVNEWHEAGFQWNWTNGKKKGIRDRLTNYEYYFGLPNGEKEGEDDLMPTLQILYDIVAMCDPTAVVSSSGLGFEAKVTPLSEDPSAKGSAAATAVFDKIKALSILESYEYKGWTTQDAVKTGYLYDELTAFRALADERGKLGTLDAAYVTAQLAKSEHGDGDHVNYKANYDAWVQLSDEMKALEAHAVWSKSFTTFEKATGTTQKAYKADEALAELIGAAYQIKTVGKVTDSDNDGADPGKIGVDTNFKSSARLVSFYDFFMTSGAPLPTYVKTMTDALKVPDYYNDFFYPLSRMVQLAVRIHTASITEIEKLTGAEIEFLNKYWVSSFEMKGLLKDHWWANNEGERYFAWIDWKLGEQFTAMLGGTVEGKTLPSDYIEYINGLLTAAHYTPDAARHNWGIVGERIYKDDLAEKTLKVVQAFEKIGDLDTYVAKGWKVPDETTPIKGYLYSEADYYKNTIKPLVDALTEDDIEAVELQLGVGTLDEWETLSEEVLAITEEKAAIEIAAATDDSSGATAKTYTAGAALGELLAAIAKVNAADEKLRFDNGIHKGVSFRPYFFYFELQANGITIPSVILDRMDAVKMDDAVAAEKFETDVKYIYAVMKIAKAITADANHALTAEEIALVNETMVGKDKFVDGGFSYAYLTDTEFGDPVSWHAQSKGYLVYFGFKSTTTFDTYQKLVIKYLVDKYHATALVYDNTNATEENVMGIVAAIAAPTAG